MEVIGKLHFPAFCHHGSSLWCLLVKRLCRPQQLYGHSGEEKNILDHASIFYLSFSCNFDNERLFFVRSINELVCIRNINCVLCEEETEGSNIMSINVSLQSVRNVLCIFFSEIMIDMREERRHTAQVADKHFKENAKCISVLTSSRCLETSKTSGVGCIHFLHNICTH
jgi:hypothetical protein